MGTEVSIIQAVKDNLDVSQYRSSIGNGKFGHRRSTRLLCENYILFFLKMIVCIGKT